MSFTWAFQYSYTAAISGNIIAYVPSGYRPYSGFQVRVTNFIETITEINSLYVSPEGSITAWIPASARGYSARITTTWIAAL